MASGQFENLVPKNGLTLMVLLICRVSKPGVKGQRKKGQQDERSLDDQEAMLRDLLQKHVHMPFEVRVIAGGGSGERLDRKESRDAEDAVESGLYDLVLSEDLGRIFRRMEAFQFCELAEDHDTRVIAVNDHVDTGTDGWRLNAYFATMRHELYNADTAKRIRRSHRSRFLAGNVFQCEIFGYVKPKPVGEEPVSDADVHKDPAAEAIYDEWFRRLEDEATFAEVADWLNASGVPTGPYARSEQWDGTMVGRITRNPILKGLRVRNKRMSKRVNKSGQRKSVKAPPEERIERECPHLAFIEPERYDRVLAMLSERNSMYSRGREGRQDTRKNVSRKRTKFPGQCIYCGICGRLFVYGGHGQANHLMCQGAREHKCWNGVSVDGPLAAAKLAEAVSHEIEDLEDFDTAFEVMVNDEARHTNESLDGRVQGVNRDLERIRREVDNVLQAVRSGSHSQLLSAELERLEQELARLQREKAEAERTRVEKIILPSAVGLQQLYRDAFRGLAVDGFEFAGRMRRLLPRIVVFPVQLCDPGSKIVLRAHFRLQLASLVPDFATRTVLQQTLDRTMMVDLFNSPQRELFRSQIVALRKAGNTEREAAQQLRLTITAAQSAAALQRMMDKLGLSDPYVAVAEPPEDCTKLRRHKHHRYHFEPLDDAGVV